MCILQESYIVVCYVDKRLVFPETEEYSSHFREEVQTRFVIKDIGEPSQFLRMEIEWLEEENGVGLRQTKLIEELLDCHGMTDCKPTDTPTSLYGQVLEN